MAPACCSARIRRELLHCWDDLHRHGRPHPLRHLDERLAKALSHPLRQRILQRLNDAGIASPNELSQALGEALGNVSYHVRVLRELDCLELARTEQRRGALEHYYRATARPWLDDNQWARLPPAFRRKTLGRTLGDLFTDASEASRQGGFDHPQAHVSRALLDVDEEGWENLVSLLGDTLDAVLRIHAESAGRHADRGDDSPPPIHTEVGLVQFRREA